MEVKINAFGHTLQISPQSINTGPVDKNMITKGIEILKKYKKGKENLENRIIENEKWYKMRHWELIRKKANNQDPEPTTAWLFNSLANKHADAMDNYPEPNILPREQSDEEEAQNLSDIIPLVIEKNKFERTYNDAWWYKLKNGTCAYGVFWNKELENGLGDIDIRCLDLLNLFWEPGKRDIQKSRSFFIVDLVDDDILEEEYPHLRGKLHNKVIDVKQYVYDDTIDTTDKSVVVDWYYKKRYDGKWILHLTKFVGENKIWSSEDDELYAKTGIYDHGEYPVIFDVLFPEEGSPVGFGYIDVMKNPQMYIDKLDQIIVRNALQAGKKRWFIKDNGNVNEKEYADWNNDFVHVSGDVSETNIREIQIKPLDAFIVQHRQQKIDELKETSGTNDFNRGNTGGGVTAAAAIAALQEAGNKLARDMIKGSYRAFTEITYMCIELIRQFYDEERKFRIEGPSGQPKYISYSNARLKPQELPKAYEDEGLIPDPDMLALGKTVMVPDPNYEPKYRKPIFDIKVKPQKTNPFSRMAQNELAKELYAAGFFDPSRADQALIALELMDFEGKASIIERISRNQTLLMQMQQMKQTMDKMAMIIEQITGRPMTDEGMEVQKGNIRTLQNKQPTYTEQIVQNASVSI